MPRKPLHPTIYPPQTRESSIQAFASIIARSAVRIAQSEENPKPVEPDIEQQTVHPETSVKPGNIELCLNPRQAQLNLFGEVES